MKDHFKKLLLLVTLALLLFVSCSKTEDAPKTPIAITGGEVFRSQVVTINLPDTDLPENEYQATLGDVVITITKSGDHKLLFMVPYSTSIGIHTLNIPTLNNTKINYDVKNTVLAETPEATMAPFKVNLDTFALTLDTSAEAVALQSNLNNFKEVFDNATIEKKTEMAILYKANKALFDDIILNDFSTITGRNVTPGNITTLAKHSAAVYLMAAGAIVAIVDATKIGAAVGSVLVGVGAYKARGYFLELINSKLSTINCSLGGVNGTTNRNATATPLSFEHNVSRTLPLNNIDRDLIVGDATNTKPAAVSFFKVYNLYNYWINKINNIIIWVNNNIYLANFSTIPLEQLATTSPEVAKATNQTIYNHFTFSITDPKLTLVSSTLQSDGQMALKINIIGSPTTPIESFLNYSYSDEFNTFSGKLPIKVSYPAAEVTIGSQVWMTKNLDVDHYRNGDEIPQVQDVTQWWSLTTGAWCYYNNDSANGTTYGKLYNWYAVSDPRGLAPIGYHIPSNAEWTTLEAFTNEHVTGSNNLKATSGWNSSTYSNPTNSTGFTAVPAGFRASGASGQAFTSMGDKAYWWSSNGSGNGWDNYMNDRLFFIGDSDDSRWGESVRCIKD